VLSRSLLKAPSAISGTHGLFFSLLPRRSPSSLSIRRSPLSCFSTDLAAFDVSSCLSYLVASIDCFFLHPFPCSALFFALHPFLCPFCIDLACTPCQLVSFRRSVRLSPFERPTGISQCSFLCRNHRALTMLSFDSVVLSFFSRLRCLVCPLLSFSSQSCCAPSSVDEDFLLLAWRALVYFLFGSFAVDPSFFLSPFP